MKRFTINTLLILLTANVFSETILLKGGLVHQGNGEVATTSDILIADKRIVGVGKNLIIDGNTRVIDCLLYTSPSPRDKRQSRMPSSA